MKPEKNRGTDKGGDELTKDEGVSNAVQLTEDENFVINLPKANSPIDPFYNDISNEVLDFGGMGLYLAGNRRNMKQPSETLQLIIRILIVLAFIVYIISLFGEKAPLFRGDSFQDISVYLLFIVFLAGFITIWIDELISGILLVAWYGFEWCLGLWVWDDPDMALAMGFLIFITGILSIINGVRKRAASEPAKS